MNCHPNLNNNIVRLLAPPLSGIYQTGTHTKDKTNHGDDTIHKRIPRASRSEYAARLHTRITEVKSLSTTVMSDYKLSI